MTPSPSDTDLMRGAAREALSCAISDGIGKTFFILWDDKGEGAMQTHIYKVVEYRPGDNPEVVCQWIEHKKKPD